MAGRMAVMFFVVLAFAGFGCGGGGTAGRAAIEAEMDSALSGVPSSVDFSFGVERVSDGLAYSFDRGSSTMQTSYESASTSKLVTAVIILRVVQDHGGYLSLASHPQDILGVDVWTVPDTDSLYAITLAQLLSFTSGLVSAPAGVFYTMAGDVKAIADANIGNGKVPGAEFFYASTHLQVAGLMAVRARNAAAGGSGFATWGDLFAEFQEQTGLFPAGAYDLPLLTPNNPRLAGGMHWTGEEYMAFLRALSRGELLNPTMMAALLEDRTTAGSVAIAESPIALAPPDGLGEDWHYGFGLWQEYRGSPYAGTPGSRVSSPGAYGAYPFWDLSRGFFGIVARQGELGTFPEGILIERAVQSLAEEWVVIP